MDSFINKEIFNLLSAGVFKKALNNDTFQITQFTMLVTLLVKACIPFDISFSPETQRSPASASLQIVINSTTSLTFVINFELGQNIFGGSC